MRASSEHLFWSQSPKSLEQHEKIFLSLKKIKKTIHNADLLEFIEQLLARLVDLKLYQHINCLYNTLCTDHLEEIINFIVSLKVAPPPTNPPKGSFEAVIPSNGQHAACIKLLTNVCANYNGSCSLFNSANSLLQSLLLIYHDTFLENTNVPEDYQGCCVIF